MGSVVFDGGFTVFAILFVLDVSEPDFEADVFGLLVFGLEDLSVLDAVAADFEFEPVFAGGRLVDAESFDLGLLLLLVFDAFVDFDELFAGFLDAEGLGVGFFTAAVELPVFFCVVVVWLKTGNSKKQEIKTTAKYFIRKTTESPETSHGPPF